MGLTADALQVGQKSVCHLPLTVALCFSCQLLLVAVQANQLTPQLDTQSSGKDSMRDSSPFAFSDNAVFRR